jgi:hypothetical protein
LDARHSLRPLIFRADGFCKTSDASRREDAEPCFGKWGNVIASSEVTKQSTLSLRGEMDRFAEPSIVRAFARPVGADPVGLAMPV